jgi:hypothetical protein
MKVRMLLISTLSAPHPFAQSWTISGEAISVVFVSSPAGHRVEAHLAMVSVTGDDCA